MSTYASISMLCQDGSVFTTAVKYDGYLSGVGQDLQKYYKTESYVEKLLSHGNIRCLGRSIGETEYFYEEFDEQTVYVDWIDYEANVDEQYNYMYCDGNWTVRRGNQRNFESY